MKALWDCFRSDKAECAKSCMDISSVFIFGRMGSGSQCQDGRCKCWCIVGASDGSCTQIEHDGYDLYKVSMYTETFVLPQKKPQVPGKYYQSLHLCDYWTIDR